MTFATIFAQLCIVAFLSLSLGGCSAENHQQKLAAKAVAGLQADFNQPRCDSVSTNLDIRNDSETKEWLQGCENLRTRLGSWKAFTISKIDNLSGAGSTRAERVVGTAVFVKDHQMQTFTLETYWHVKGDRILLYFLQLSGNAVQISLPHRPDPVRKEIDPSPELRGQ